MANKNPWRLDKNVIPEQYFVNLEPNLKDFTFHGLVNIRVYIAEPTSFVTLHAIELDIKYAKFDNRLLAKKITYNKRLQTVTFEFSEQLRSGTRWLAIEFTGILNDKMHGFYRTSYMVNGEKHWGATTQFEATDARRVFPCFDEPEPKAQYVIQLFAPKHMTVLSNMPPIREDAIDSETKMLLFDITPPMPSYLVAFVVAELEYVEGFTEDGKPVRVWATPGKREMCHFALEVALHSIKYFEKWFGVPYALPKLDLVAVPDFAAGAMEDWGLIIFRETALLIDLKNSSAAMRQRVAEVINHEIAHQWFGNLVTMCWWTHLWLNEGFASYAGPKAVDAQFPQWDVWTQYLTDEYLPALKADSLNNTHAIEVPVKNPDEIREIFDEITYGKGSVINRMLEHYLGAQDYARGLKLYFEKYKFGNATTDDLWQALEESSGKPVSELMARYTRQKGYPVVTAYLDEENVLYLEQKRFIFDGSKDTKQTLWHIPILMQLGESKKKFSYYMRDRKAVVQLNSRANSWIKINPGQSGFYRVAYSPEMMLRLEDAIREGAMPTIDRIGLLNDAFALSRVGFIKTRNALELLEAYEGEDNFNVWVEIATGLAEAGKLISADTGSYMQFKSFAKDFFRPIAERLGWDKIPGEPFTDIFLRSFAITSMGKWEDQDTIDEARRRFNSFVNGGELDPDIRNAVFSTVARYGSEKEFLAFIKLYENATSPEENVRALRALASFKDPVIHATALQMALGDKVRLQDKLRVVCWYADKKTHILSWEFVKENWDTFLELYGHGGLGFMRNLITLPEGFSTQEQLEDVEQFFATHDVSGADRAVKQCLETIRSNIAWRQRSRDEVLDWLEEKFSYRT